MKKKLTTQQKDKIKEIYAKDKTPQRLLGIRFGVSQKTISYHTSDTAKEKSRQRERDKYAKLTKKERSDLYRGRKDYAKQYWKNRYKYDPEFRMRHIERVKRGKKK